ncbi:MAG: hypothetical protein WD845_11920 [Pirellulales bacterium]
MHVAWWRKLVAILGVSAGLVASAAAVEPVDEFLAALRQRQWFDQANAYLDALESNSQLDEAIRQRIPFERGVTTLQAATAQRDPAKRDAELTRAGQWFAEFSSQFPEHPLAGTAKVQLGVLQIERARAAVATAARSAQDEPGIDAARGQFEEARRQFDGAIKDLETRLAQLPKLVDPNDSDTAARKQQLAGDLVQLQLLRPSIDYELAATHPSGSAAARKHLEAAAANYHSLYETYRTRASGLLARLWEGRCYQQLEKMPQALACFRELMELPAAEETRTVRTKSTRHALECLTSGGEKKFQEAVERGKRWEKESGASAGDPDALAIRYLTAVALQGQSSALPAKDPERKKLAGFARDYVVPVAEQPGEYQRPAKMLLVALSGNKDAKGAADGASQPAFAEYFEQGKQSIAQMQAVESEINALGSKGDDAALESLRQQRDNAANEASHWLQQALRSSDAKTSIDDLNSARYYLCFLNWDAGRLHDAAVLGEFLVQRYPDSSPGRQGARIALAAYVKMYAESTLDEKQFEIERIERLGDAILKRWPGSEESDEAAMQLLNFAASRSDWDKAIAYLGGISPDSPRRGQAELRAGQALWSAYLRRSQLPQEERPPQADLDALKKRAQEVLAEGIGRMEKSGEVDATLAAAVFAMAQICVDTGQPDQAIAWLEKAKIGPLTLVNANHPVAARDSFAIETYKLALRAYVAVTPQQVDKAEAAMDALEKLVQGAGDANAAENLTKIYVSLGRELEQQLQDLRKSGQTKQLESVSKAFEIFLDRVTKRETGNSYASLNWVGETYFSLGAGFDAGPGNASPQATAYFAKAADAYKRMLDVVQNDPKFKDNPDSLTGARLRLADCHRRAGQFDDALAVVVEVLKQKPMLLPAQVQAAETLQARGAIDPKNYGLAILGDRPARDGKNAVWGWAKLSQLTMSNEQFAGTFHHARMNLAESRYRYALVEKDAQKRANILAAAKQDLWTTFKLRPELGGEETAVRYDRLLKLIQASLGEKEAGLQEFRDRNNASTADATTK